MKCSAYWVYYDIPLFFLPNYILFLMIVENVEKNQINWYNRKNLIYSEISNLFHLFEKKIFSNPGNSQRWVQIWICIQICFVLKLQKCMHFYLIFGLYMKIFPNITKYTDFLQTKGRWMGCQWGLSPSIVMTQVLTVNVLERTLLSPAV